MRFVFYLFWLLCVYSSSVLALDQHQRFENVDYIVRQQFGVYPDHVLQGYLDNIVRQILEANQLSQLNLNVIVLDSSKSYLLSTSSGHIYISRGVLAQLNSEAELAFLLAHEIAHSAAKDSLHFFANYDSLNHGAGVLKQRVMRLLEFGYGENIEFLADQRAVQYAANAQFDPTQFKYGLMRFDQTYFSHAPIWKRVKKLASYTQNIHSKNKVIHGETYLSHINGLYLGQMPWQGRLIENQYENAAFMLQFAVPKGWEMSNQATKDQFQCHFVHSPSGISSTLSLFWFAQPPDLMTFVQEKEPLTYASKIRHARLNIYTFPAYETVYRVTSRLGAVTEWVLFWVNENYGYQLRFVYPYRMERDVRQLAHYIFQSMQPMSSEYRMKAAQSQKEGS